MKRYPSARRALVKLYGLVVVLAVVAVGLSLFGFRPHTSEWSLLA